MDNLNEIKKKIDDLYQEYKSNKSNLNVGKTKEVASLLADQTFSDGVVFSDIASELARFSADVSGRYFDALTKSAKPPIETLDGVLKAFTETNIDQAKSQYYVKKYIESIISIMKNYGEKSSESALLPELVAFSAEFANKNNKDKDAFQKLVDKTNGGIYSLDYSGLNDKKMSCIWNVTNIIYPDINASKYSGSIINWANKYGYISKPEEKTTDDEMLNRKETSLPASTSKEVALPCVNSVDNAAKDVHSEMKPTSERFDKLYKDICECMIGEREAIVSAFNEALAPMIKAVDLFKAEIRNNQRLAEENNDLKNKITALTREIQSLKTDNENFLKQLSELEKRNSELDIKLDDAYSINSREASLEAQKIRLDIKNALAFLYDDWLDYEFSDVSEENFESLQAIIKKIFRTLERNGIDFKGNGQ